MDNVNGIVLVNYKDEQVGISSKETVHKKGLLHRAFSVYITNEKDEILLQKRNINKYHSGGLWSNTCCSHPTDNCNILTYATERLYQEIGLKSNLKEIGQFVYRTQFTNGLIEYEYDHVLFGKIVQTNIYPNPNEIDDLSWYSIEDIESLLITKPELFTAWFFQSFFILKNFILNNIQ